MTPTEVLIVGAGPAGCAAALVLARAGVHVRLIDRARFPRDKLCGDTMNPGTLSILDRLGVADVVRSRALPVTGMTVSGPGGATVTADYPGGLLGGSLARRELDLALVEAAVHAGAHFDAGVAVRAPLMADGAARRVLGARVGTSAGEQDVKAPIVIAADGRHSRLAFSLGMSRYAAAPKRWAFGTYFVGVVGTSSRGEMHIRPDGYVGIAPLPGGVVNVCVVRALSGFGAQRQSSRATGAATARAAQIITAAVNDDSTLRERFERAERVSDVTTLGPLGVESHQAGAAGLLLAGDAAGFIDPMTGDGLRFALRGGELAAEAALRELESGQPAYPSLGRARAREFRFKWRLNRSLRWLVGSPRGLDVAATVATRWAAPFEYLIGVAGDVHLAEARPR